ncbi:MAG TPA: nuclear transport factor 2 family protein [Thermoleophilaceae bacterium]|nr:nuclear transport factor 2 family protein [Thermoleophilaceae bacterium]
MWDAFARGDGKASLEAFHPDVEWDGRNIPDGVLGRGRQVVLDHARHWASIWDDWTVEVEKLVQVTPDTVVTYSVIIRRVGFSDPEEALPAVRSWSAA